MREEIENRPGSGKTLRKKSPSVQEKNVYSQQPFKIKVTLETVIESRIKSKWRQKTDDYFHKPILSFTLKKHDNHIISHLYVIFDKKSNEPIKSQTFSAMSIHKTCIYMFCIFYTCIVYNIRILYSIQYMYKNVLGAGNSWWAQAWFLIDSLDSMSKMTYKWKMICLSRLLQFKFYSRIKVNLL